jgi:dTDP-4-dehydrorhamnose reductase
MKEHLVIGGDSFIGRQLVNRLGCSWTSRHWETHPHQQYNVLCGNPPEWARTVFMCAAVTGFAACESNPDAYRVNVDAPLRIARSMPEGSKFIFLSSEAVRTALHTNYGLMKAMAEHGLLAIGNAVVVRLPRVTSENVQAMVGEIIRLSDQQPGLYEIANGQTPNV